MKAKVLISHYGTEGGHELLRIYMEPDFIQAEKDLDLLSHRHDGITIELTNVEIYNEHKVEFNN